MNDAIPNLLAAKIAKGEILTGKTGAGPGEAAVCQVGEDTQVHPTAGEVLNFWREELEHGVNQVSAHGVLHVDDQVDDQHRSNRGFGKEAGLHVARTAAIVAQAGVKIGDILQQFVFMCQHCLSSSLNVWQIEQLQLTDHLLGGHAGLKTTTVFGEPGHEGDTSDHRRLFNYHGYKDLMSIDDEVLSDSQRQAVEPHHVFDHCVGAFKVEPTVSLISLEIFWGNI